MKTLLALSLLALFGGNAAANDLRDARSLAAKLVKEPAKHYVGRNVHQRDGMAGSALSARRVEGNRIAVETWKKKGNVETTTTRTFELSNGKLEHILTESQLKHGKSDGRGNVDYFPTVERTQVLSGQRIGTSATIVTTDRRTGKTSLQYIAKEPAAAVTP